MNECGSCGNDFASLRAFDAHRVGKHAYSYSEGVRSEPLREDGRRCLGPSELRHVGMGLDAQDRWFLVAHRDSVRRAFSVVADMGEAA